MTTSPLAPDCLVESVTSDAVGKGEAAADGSGLRFVVRNPGTEPMWCERLELTLPIGTGPGHLAAAPGQLALTGDRDDWSLVHMGGDAFALVGDRPAELRPGVALELALDGVGTGTEPGNAPLIVRVHAQVDGRAAAVTEDQFSVCTADPKMLDYFKADDLSVRRNCGTILRWKGLPRETSELKPTYTLYQGTAVGKDVTSTMDHKTGVGECPTGPLTASTAFMMLAQATDSGGQKPIVAGITIAVTVIEADLVAGRLQVNGPVVLLKEPVAINPDPDELRTKAYASGILTATTDGMVAARIQTDVNGRAASATVTVTATTTSGKVSHRQQTAAVKGSPGNLLVPVPSGASVQVKAGASGAEYRFQSTWFPMGAGKLKPAAPRDPLLRSST